MRELLRVPQKAETDFDIPLDFNYKTYVQAIDTLAEEYFHTTNEEHKKFVHQFSSALLSVKGTGTTRIRVFTKRKVHALCNEHSLNSFRRLVGDFIFALQNAVTFVN